MAIMTVMRTSLLTSWGARLNGIGFERTRRAIAALALSLFVSLYLLIAMNAPEGFTAAMFALSLCYGVAFVGVVSELFWGRWFASGLGYSGVMVSIGSMVIVGWNPVLAIYGGLHAVVVTVLMGAKMAARYDLQPAWRERYKMDEFGVARLKKTVTRAAASLPSMILWALGPREGSSMTFSVISHQAIALVALGLAVLGIAGLTRTRTWGVLALAAAAVVLIPGGGVAEVNLLSFAGPTLAELMLLGALVPFTLPIVRFWRRSRTAPSS